VSELAGFIAHEGGKLVLHALGATHRGRGLARHLWSAVCADLVRQGASELTSSISVTNLAARLCGEAKPGQVLVSRRVFATVEDLIEVEPIGELSLKGFLKPVTTFNVLRFKDVPT
jgi:class 3 adenylate cyclase